MAAVNDERAKAHNDHTNTYRIVYNAGSTAFFVHLSSVALEYQRKVQKALKTE
jgi:hypothetical protein